MPSTRHEPEEAPRAMTRGRGPMNFEEDDFTPKGATRVPAAATPPTPLPQPMFSPEVDASTDGLGQPPTPRRLILGSGDWNEQEDMHTPCRTSAPNASVEATRRPPQISRPARSRSVTADGLNNNLVRSSINMMGTSASSVGGESSLPLPSDRGTLHGSRAAPAVAPKAHGGTSSGVSSAKTTSTADAHALSARLSVGLMGTSRHAGELARFIDTPDATRAPLASIELLVGRLQAAEEALSQVRAALEGVCSRENVCASLLRRADTEHALAEAQRLSQRTPELTMLSRNLCASVAAISNACLKQLRPSSGANAAHHPAASLDASAEAAVHTATQELAAALGLFEGCGGLSASAAHSTRATEAAAGGDAAGGAHGAELLPAYLGEGAATAAGQQPQQQSQLVPHPPPSPGSVGCGGSSSSSSGSAMVRSSMSRPSRHRQPLGSNSLLANQPSPSLQPLEQSAMMSLAPAAAPSRNGSAARLEAGAHLRTSTPSTRRTHRHHHHQPPSAPAGAENTFSSPPPPPPLSRDICTPSAGTTDRLGLVRTGRGDLTDISGPAEPTHVAPRYSSSRFGRGEGGGSNGGGGGRSEEGEGERPTSAAPPRIQRGGKVFSRLAGIDPSDLAHAPPTPARTLLFPGGAAVPAPGGGGAQPASVDPRSRRYAAPAPNAAPPNLLSPQLPDASDPGWPASGWQSFPPAHVENMGAEGGGGGGAADDFGADAGLDWIDRPCRPRRLNFSSRPGSAATPNRPPSAVPPVSGGAGGLKYAPGDPPYPPPPYPPPSPRGSASRGELEPPPYSSISGGLGGGISGGGLGMVRPSATARLIAELRPAGPLGGATLTPSGASRPGSAAFRGAPSPPVARLNRTPTSGGLGNGLGRANVYTAPQTSCGGGYL